MIFRDRELSGSGDSICKALEVSRYSTIQRRLILNGLVPYIDVGNIYCGDAFTLYDLQTAGKDGRLVRGITLNFLNSLRYLTDIGVTELKTTCKYRESLVENGDVCCLRGKFDEKQSV